MSKISIPEGMLKAADQAFMAAWNGIAFAPISNAPRIALEAALQWQKENPPAPTDIQFGELVNECRKPDIAFWDKTTEWHRSIILCGAWVNRMYDEPEPEVGRFDLYRKVGDEYVLVPPAQFGFAGYKAMSADGGGNPCGFVTFDPDKPEREVPEELHDLQWAIGDNPQADLHNKETIEAFHRGQKRVRRLWRREKVMEEGT